MKWFASFLAAAVLAFGVAVAAEQAPSKPVVLEAKQGQVTFNHTTHKDVACEKCHPPFAQKAGTKVEKDKAHAACHGCHKEQKKGPQKCVDCHKK
jgi:hypothetical protein